MRKWIHILSNIDPKNKVGDCKKCGHIKLKNHCGTWKCWNGYIEQKVRGKSKYQKIHRRTFFAKNIILMCEVCGVENKDHRFFDVHHLHGHKSEKLENLQLLCPNCHRLESIKLWDELKKVGGKWQALIR